jgi:hypothetical protein
MQMLPVMYAATDRVENTMEHFAATVARVSSREASEEGLCIHASVS